MISNAKSDRDDTFILLVDAVDINRDLLPYDLGQGFRLDAATHGEVEDHFRPWLKSHVQRLTNSSWSSLGPYEYTYMPENKGNQLSKLPSSQHRYFLFRSDAKRYDSHFKFKVNALNQCGNILEPELTLGAIVSYGTSLRDTAGNQVPSVMSGFGVNRLRLLDMWDALPKKAPKVDARILAELRRLFELRINFGKSETPITKSLALLVATDDVKPNSPLWILAQFIAIESLLAHRPNPNDPIDSITRQLKTSIPLLLRRSQELDIASKLGVEGKWETIVKKLYEFRSLIAHGDLPTDENWPNNLSIFKNRDTIDTLVRAILKALLRQALREPELVLDLKDPNGAISLDNPVD